MRFLAWTLGLTAVVVLLWLAIAWVSPSDPEEANATGLQKPFQNSVTRPKEVVRTEFHDPLPSPVLFVFNTATGQGIPNATAYVQRVSTSRYITPGGRESAARADAGGRMTLDAELVRKQTRLLVLADGFVSEHVHLSAESLTNRIGLVPGYSIEVSCRSRAGKPLAGCQVLLATRRVANPRAYSKPCIGNPASSRALWLGVSDDNGQIRIAGLPRGLYRLYVTHDTYAPNEPRFAGEEEVSVPSRAVYVTMDEFVGIAAAASDESRIAWHHWELERSAFVRNSCTERVRHELKIRLRARFKNSVVFVGVPRIPGGDHEVGVEVVLANGSACEDTWGLIPVSQIKHPVYLEARPDKNTATVTVVLSHKGKDLPDTAFTLHQVRGRRFFPARSGQRMHLPAGEYMIELEGALRPVQDWFEKRKLLLQPADDRRVRLDIPFALIPIQVKPRLPYAEFDAVLNVRLFHSGGSSTNLLGWAPDRGAIRFLVPDQKIRLYIEADGFQMASWKGTPSEAFPTPRLFDLAHPHEIVMALEYGR